MTSTINFTQPDISLRLDLSGVIEKALLSNTIAGEATDGWLGLPWAGTVARGSAQIEAMLGEARTVGVSPFHRLLQRFPSGLELPVEYTTVRIEGGEGLLAIGRSLEAVSELRARLVEGRLAIERDSWKLRDVEMRYRAMFDAASEPALIVDAADLRILEANPAARALGMARSFSLPAQAGDDERAAFEDMLRRVRDHVRAPATVLHLGRDREPWLVRASRVAVDESSLLLLNLSPGRPVDRPAPASASRELDRAAKAKIIEEQIAAIERQCVEAARAVFEQRSAPAAAAQRDTDASGSKRQ